MKFEEQYKDELEAKKKNAIIIKRSDGTDFQKGCSRFGSDPDVPADFEWPYFEDYPLSFLAQINFSDIAQYDKDELLPKSGLLSFFYEIDDQIQNDTRLEEGDSRAREIVESWDDWLLLFQMSSDKEQKWLFGDCGKLYFYIKKDDLKNRDFSNVWYNLQC